MGIREDIRQLVDDTWLIDTHTHLIEESTRLKGISPLVPCQDFAYLVFYNEKWDLGSAGMTPEEIETKFLSAEVDIHEKWRLFEPFYQKVKNTGFFRAARISIQKLYGEEDLTEDTYVALTEKMRARVRKGFYKEIIQDIARVESCQVSSFEGTCPVSEYPTLLFQDINIAVMSIDIAVGQLCEESKLPGGTLEEWHRLIDWYFETCGPRAVAVKNTATYFRRLDFQEVPASAAAPLFARHAKGEKLTGAEMKALQDHLFHYCIRRATDFDLPVKFHTGLVAGWNAMSLERVAASPKDFCPLLKKYPRTKFVIMHMCFPYQDETIALGKHFSNAYIDMCGIWSTTPASAVRFLKEMLVSAPVSKVFTFGADVGPVEPVVGNAWIARQGIVQAVSELVTEGWLAESDVPGIVHRIMRGNQYEVFRLEEKARQFEQRENSGSGPGGVLPRSKNGTTGGPCS